MMLDEKEKESLKEASLTNLEKVLEELKDKLPVGDSRKDTILHLLGRIKELEQPEKLYEIAKYALEQEEKEKNIDEMILGFYSVEKNKVRHALFELVNEL